MNKIIDDGPKVSVITKIEVLGFNNAGEHYQLLLDFMNDAEIFVLNGDVIDKCISIRKNNKTKLPDVIIAATAIVKDFVLITRNTADFKNLKEIQIFNPYTLQS